MVTVNRVSSLIVWFVGLPTNTGLTFTSSTVTVNALVTLASPSLTTVVIVLVEGPCASVGVQLITPLVSITAPTGAFSSE